MYQKTRTLLPVLKESVPENEDVAVSIYMRNPVPEDEDVAASV
jgi:hypothetical protein